MGKTTFENGHVDFFGSDVLAKDFIQLARYRNERSFTLALFVG
jgi:hypothetical protein